MGFQLVFDQFFFFFQLLEFGHSNNGLLTTTHKHEKKKAQKLTRKHSSKFWTNEVNRLPWPCWPVVPHLLHDISTYIFRHFIIFIFFNTKYETEKKTPKDQLIDTNNNNNNKKSIRTKAGIVEIFVLLLHSVVALVSLRDSLHLVNLCVIRECEFIKLHSVVPFPPFNL